MRNTLGMAAHDCISGEACMAGRCHRVALVFALLATVSILGCARPDLSVRRAASTSLAAGSTARSSSGLTFTVPAGATGSITKASAAHPTELIELRDTDSLGFVLISFPSGKRNTLSQVSTVAVTPDGTVAVLINSGSPRTVVVETNVEGAAPGRVLITAPAGNPDGQDPIGLAQRAWRSFRVLGVELPPAAR